MENLVPQRAPTPAPSLITYRRIILTVHKLKTEN
jgi:hypothetical protein